MRMRILVVIFPLVSGAPILFPDLVSPWVGPFGQPHGFGYNGYHDPIGSLLSTGLTNSYQMADILANRCGFICQVKEDYYYNY